MVHFYDSIMLTNQYWWQFLKVGEKNGNISHLHLKLVTNIFCHRDPFTPIDVAINRDSGYKNWIETMIYEIFKCPYKKVHIEKPILLGQYYITISYGPYNVEWTISYGPCDRNSLYGLSYVDCIILPYYMDLMIRRYYMDHIGLYYMVISYHRP